MSRRGDVGMTEGGGSGGGGGGRFCLRIAFKFRCQTGCVPGRADQVGQEKAHVEMHHVTLRCRKLSPFWPFLIRLFQDVLPRLGLPVKRLHRSDTQRRRSLFWAVCMVAARPSHEESSFSGSHCCQTSLATCPVIGQFEIPDACLWEPRKSLRWGLELRKEVCCRKSVLLCQGKPCRSLAAARLTVSHIWKGPVPIVLSVPTR